MPEPTLHQKMDALRDDQIRGFDVLERDSAAMIARFEAHTRQLEVQTGQLDAQTQQLEAQTASLHDLRATLALQNQTLLRALERLDDQ